MDRTRGIVPFTSAELVQVVLKNVKSERGKNERVVWRYHWRQRYRSLVSHCTGKNAGILVENRKVIFETWCSVTQKRQKPVTEMHHKSYSSPEPQRRSRWKKLALFFSLTPCVYCFTCRLMCPDTTTCAHFLIRKESATGSTLRSHER